MTASAIQRYLFSRPGQLSFMLTLLLLLSPPLPAQQTDDAIRWEARPDIAAFAGRPLSWAERVRLSLIASGVRQEDLAGYQQKIAALVDEAKTATVGLDAASRADKLLQLLHQKTLGTYSFYQTRVDVLLDTGSFNCVSSATVYNLVAEAIGLKTAAVSTTDHAFSQVVLPDRTVDVETTSALGFDPGQKREFHDAFGKLTGFAYVPPGNYSRRTLIDDRGLIALILQNLMTEAQSKGDNVTPVGLAWDVRALEPGAEADALVVRSYQNYLVDLNNRAEYQRGLQIVTRLESKVGRSGQTDQLAAAFAQNLITARISAGDYSGARDAAASWAARTSRTRPQWDAMILKAQAQSEYQKKGWAATMDWLTGYSGSNPQEVPQIRVSLTLQELQRRMAGGRWEEALGFWYGLPSALKSDAQISRLRDVLVYNAAVEYHNRFASLMNRGSTEQARSVLEEGLRRFPDSPLLKQDAAELARRGQ
ncbi:hypothetical protein [Salinispira pacifica]